MSPGYLDQGVGHIVGVPWLCQARAGVHIDMEQALGARPGWPGQAGTVGGLADCQPAQGHLASWGSAESSVRTRNQAIVENNSVQTMQ